MNRLKRFCEIFAKIIAKNLCSHISWLRGHGNDYADFEGLSLTLKEQAAEIKYSGMFTFPIATFLTFLNWRLPNDKIENFENCHRITSWSRKSEFIWGPDFLSKQIKVEKLVTRSHLSTHCSPPPLFLPLNPMERRRIGGLGDCQLEDMTERIINPFCNQNWVEQWADPNLL